MRSIVVAALVLITPLAAFAQTPAPQATPPKAAAPAAAAPKVTTPKVTAPKISAPKISPPATTPPEASAATPAAPKAAAAKQVPPARPAPQTPVDTAKALAQNDRVAIQSDLAWTSFYNGNINGEVNDRMITAIKAFQKDQGGKETGVLNPQERDALTAAAKVLQDNAGWKIGLDPLNGIRLGLPTKLAPQQSSGDSGTKWQSAQGQIQIETWRARDTGLTTAAMAERETKDPAGRKVGYRVVNKDFFVLSGTQNQKNFYVRGQIKGSEIRGMTILYDQATEGTMNPVVIAMSSAFTPFPAGAAAATDAPPPRKSVEYATGLVVSADGAIVTDRQAVDACQFLVVPGYGNADRIVEDKSRELALLRIYGARDLKPLAIAATPAKPDVDLTGIADPQNQGGGAAVTRIKAKISAGLGTAGGAGEMIVSPVPGLGFSGAPATDSDGKFAGLILLRSAVIAGPTPATVASQAALVPADQVRQFLNANGVNPSTGAGDPKAAVVRVICVRK